MKRRNDDTLKDFIFYLLEVISMSIIWKYLDKRAAAIAALKDYDSMKFIIDNTDSEIKSAHQRMISLGSPKFDGMPHSKNPHVGEERTTSCIDEIDILKERYRQAVEYMGWFAPAWNELSSDERYVLETIYGKESEYNTGTIYEICEHFHIERSSAYNRKNRALAHLVNLLLGKN